MRPVRPFSLLASVYDAIMNDIDYEHWGQFILDVVRARGWHGGRCLDIGCGTGNSTFPFVARGYEVVGLDASSDMLRIAREKLPPVRFVQGSFETFELTERFDLIYSMFDSLNNLLTKEDFLASIKNIKGHLSDDGFFVFDVNTTIGLRDLWESGRAEGWSNDVYYRWEHSFDEASGLAKVEAYCENETSAFTEVHFERPYDAPELRELLGQAGFDVELLSYPDAEPAGADAARLWVVASQTKSATP